MKFSHEASIALPVSAIHLGDWLFNMTDSDYKACAKGHRAIGTTGGGRFDCMVNVESMAGTLLIQHYSAQVIEPNHLLLYSSRSRAYLMHLLPFHLKVGWEMQVRPISANESKLRCTIEVNNPLWVRFLGIFIASGFWVRRHLVEETYGFANDIQRKNGGLGPAPSH